MKKGQNFGARSFGDSTNYESTVTMNFRGQDKKRAEPGQLGVNPNTNFASVEDDYIQNLYQQIHFMDLELQILRDKVIEDEKKSGIGSLYDDDKSSHTHINLLRVKYAQMRKDFEKKMNDLMRQSLKVKGQEFVLDAQIKVMKEQRKKLEDLQSDFQSQHNQDFHDQRKLTDETKKATTTIESEVRIITNSKIKEAEIHHDHKMTQWFEREDDREYDERHELYVKLMKALIEKKEKELKDKVAELKALEDKIKANAKYQAILAEILKLTEEIEINIVENQFLEGSVENLKFTVHSLNTRKDNLQEEKKTAQDLNNERKVRKAADENTEKKRLKAKLEKDKSQAILDLIANFEMVKDNSMEFDQNLAGKIEYYDKLLRDMLLAEETLRLEQVELDEDTENVKVQDIDIKKLDEQIQKELAIEEDFTEKLADSKKTNKIEDERNRKLQQEYTALCAKKEFIETKYDYTTNV